MQGLFRRGGVVCVGVAFKATRREHHECSIGRGFYDVDRGRCATPVHCVQGDATCVLCGAVAPHLEGFFDLVGPQVLQINATTDKPAGGAIGCERGDLLTGFIDHKRAQHSTDPIWC